MERIMQDSQDKKDRVGSFFILSILHDPFHPVPLFNFIMMHLKIITPLGLLLLLSHPLFCEEPWGKDVDLERYGKPATFRYCPEKRPAQGAAQTLVRFHQNNISKTDGPRSHFVPSSSQYTLEAMQRFGSFNGFLLGCDRLMRENKDAWIYPTVDYFGYQYKYDPIYPDPTLDR
jgi:putative component of membrane protein insertase Oxa1/YidC/SpoIIIJ protein YidD